MIKNLKVTNFKGNEFIGDWNEKIYESKNENKELVRIYINNEPIHITKEELERISNNVEQAYKAQAKQKSLNTKIRIKEMLEDLTEKDSIEIAHNILIKLIENKKIDCRDKINLFSELNTIVDTIEK